MNFYQLPDGEVAGFDDPMQAPTGAVAITAEQFAAAALTRVLTLAQAQSDRTTALYGDCQSAITGGFSSSALGSAYTYPATSTDQSNQQAVAACSTGGLLYCADSTGAWALVQHTQAQAQQVVSDFVKWLNTCQQKLAELTKQVNAPDATVATVQAVTWASGASATGSE